MKASVPDVRTKAALFFFGCLVALSGAVCSAQNSVLTQASQLESQGHFKDAAAALSRALQDPGLTTDKRGKLEFELDRLARIRKDFPFTRAALFAELKKSVDGLTEAEFDQWLTEGRFDSRDFDGDKRFMVSSVSNLFFRYPELNPRRRPPLNQESIERAHIEVCEAIKKAALAERRPYVLPKRFHVTMDVAADANAAPAGEIIRAWLPIPRRYPFQGDFELISASAPVKRIDDDTSPLRAIYLEQPAKKSAKTDFRIDYNYTIHGVFFDIKPDQIRPIPPGRPDLMEFTHEAPHVVFTPEIRALSDQITGAETNSYLKAKKFYDWISQNIKYSYAIEYSTIRNISDYCRSHGYGDCGQEALLFITLCRLNGIPARWQSGWNTFPAAKSIHDWSEIYLEPYGWIPVDPYMGIYATRYAPSLSAEQKQELRDFYFGGLDQYRIAANADHNQSLSPSKRSMRSDNVDFQRGELEWGDHNIYFDHYSYELTIKEIHPPGAD